MPIEFEIRTDINPCWQVCMCCKLLVDEWLECPICYWKECFDCDKYGEKVCEHIRSKGYGYWKVKHCKKYSMQEILE